MTDRAFQALDDRIAGLPVDDALHEGVPQWLEPPLRQWLNRALYSADLARRVALRLRWRPSHAQATYLSEIIGRPSDQLLTAVDAVLQLHPGWGWRGETWGDRPMPGHADWMAQILVDLEQILDDAGSLYTLDWAGHCLIRRVDATVTEAFASTVQAADPTAADHLRTAWAAAYGLAPEPDLAYSEAVKAVEAVACPLVQEKKATDGSATLGTVIGELGKNAPHKWELLLPGKDGVPRDVTAVVGMMEMLWQAQVSRHAGAPKSRRQDQAEAEAAVHLAATLVQWLTTGVLRRSP